jgi:hypothetical protein
MVLWDHKLAQLWSTTSPFVNEGLSDEDLGRPTKKRKPRRTPAVLRKTKWKIGVRYASIRRNARYKNRHHYPR